MFDQDRAIIPPYRLARNESGISLLQTMVVLTLISAIAYLIVDFNVKVQRDTRNLIQKSIKKDLEAYTQERAADPDSYMQSQVIKSTDLLD